MLVADYDDFVTKTDQFKDRCDTDRRSIALYGLVGEIGSLVSAVKKNLLAESGDTDWHVCNDEIVEEIGDVIWYCFSLAQIENPRNTVNIFTNDIALLKKEISSDNDRGNMLRGSLDTSRKDKFLEKSSNFPNTEEMSLSDYQELAYLTARTEGRDLLEVCLAVLWQLGAELLRQTLPEVELTINKNVADRQPNVVLGEIAWHLAAVSSVFEVSLNHIATKNVQKVEYRSDRSQITPLHDEAREQESERFPRKFEIAFASVGLGRSRMYLDGRQLGDELTDNAYDDDGYRFHDVMHLANAAHLGWSPVLRKLLGRKRRSDSKLDEVEDGARAQIVEELVIKAIHTEGNKLTRESGIPAASEPVRQFTSKKAITFRLLKNLHRYVEGLEVQKNKFWEWEDAIYNGSDVFYKLRREKQGTVIVDLENRMLSFLPEVSIQISGATVCMGSAVVSLDSASTKFSNFLTENELAYVENSAEKNFLAKTISAKRAIFNALKIEGEESETCEMLEIKVLDSNYVSFKATSAVLDKIWQTKTLSFQLTFSQMGPNFVCTAMGVADINDFIH